MDTRTHHCGSVGIRVNGDIGHYFQTRKTTRGPSIAYLVQHCSRYASYYYQPCKQRWSSKWHDPASSSWGCLDPLVRRWYNIFLDHDLEKALNMNLILCIFEQQFRLKINFHKSEILCFGKAKYEEEHYKNLFGCEFGTLLFKYLGILIHFCRLKMASGN
jgi:hypothetical protein